VLWAGSGGNVDLDGRARSVTGAVAVPLTRVGAGIGLIERASALGMGVVLPGQAWLNQVPPSERGAGFSALPYAQREAIEPEWLSDAALRDYAEAFLETQLLFGATLVTTPAHVLTAESGYARERELALAHAAVDAWHQRQGWRPPPGLPDEAPRELYATIAVRGAHVAEAAASLIDAYADLDVDGYWIVVVNGGSSARQLGGLTRLALGLQAEAERPVTVAGVAGPHLALLAGGVAAVCAGSDSVRPSFPPVLDEHGVSLYHPAILGPVPDGDPAIRNRLFALQPCTCGHHVPHRPPTSVRDAMAHNLACLQREADEATFMTPAIDEQRLLARVGRADRLRRSLGLSDLPHGWQAVVATARALRAGEDLAEDA
jgi:hypothetical protein